MNRFGFHRILMGSRRQFFILALVLTGVQCLAAQVSLFDGKTFSGWEGDTPKTWRIANGEIIAGKPDVKQPRNEFLCTTRDYSDFDLRLEYRRGENNGGIQFRSERVPNHHEVSGYQADFAPGIDGCLYDESRRNRFLAVFGVADVDLASEAGRPGALIKRALEAQSENAKKLGIGEWNRYRVRAEGQRIQLWVNDVLTVEYTEREVGIPRSGKIAIQIHSGATEIRYRNITIEELETKAAPRGAFQLKANDVIALTGGANIERTRFNGYLQTYLVAGTPDARIKVRNFGWEGDTVFEQWRDAGVVKLTESWRQQREWRTQLRDAGASVVVAQFGQMESLKGIEMLPRFMAAYENLLSEFSEDERRVVLVAPIPFEGNLAARNPVLEAYTKGIRELAAKLQLEFIEIEKPGFTPASLTENGYQLNDSGHRLVAQRIAQGLGFTPVENEAVRLAVLETERLWFDYWRPMNWAFLSGDRTTQPYSKDWRDGSTRIFPQEMEDFLPLLQQADENIWNALAKKPLTPIAVRSSIPTEPPSVPSQSPEVERASFKLLDGFDVNLFASEEDGIVKPIQMRWDERGRLWVACAVSYPQIKPGEKPNDYVLVCEDTDGDGRADKFTKFVDGLFMPSGLEFGDGGLYVAQGTELLHFKDTDGDGKADTKRIVLGGFGTADSHQMINSLNWGFGGELWFTQGHHIYSRVETPFGVETLNRSGLWRWRRHTGHLDPFFQFSSGGVNNWGVNSTEYGQPFHKSGANFGAWFSAPGLVRSTLAVDSQAMNIFTAPSKQVGMDFLHSSHFPQEMQGRAIIGGYYANILEQHELKCENGVFSSTRLPNIIETSGNNFRPVEVRMGPDGAIYVADWYNPIIGHYQASYRHPDRDKTHGRIWRVTWNGGKKVTPASLAGASIPQLLEQLDSKERWVWYQSKRLLIERNSKEVVEALDEWLPKQQQNPYRRLLALSLYEAHETPRPALLSELLRSADARIRAYATHVIGVWARDGRLPDALQLLEAQIADEDALVRVEAIVAASYVGDPRAAIIATRALDKDFNSYHLHALTKTLHVSNPLWSSLLVEGKLHFDKDEHLIFALQNGWVENNIDDFRNLTGHVVNYKPSASTKAVEIMREQIVRSAGDTPRRERWLKAFAGIAQAADVPLVFELGGRNASVLAAIKSARPAEPEKLLSPLFDSDRTELKMEGIRLAGIWKVDAFASLIRKLAFEESLPQALDALLSLSPDEVAQHVLNRLAKLNAADGAAPLLNAIVSRREGRAAMERALQKPDALPPSVAKIALRTLNLLGKSDLKLSAKFMELAGINSALPAYTKEAVTQIVNGANTIGNAARGKLVYEQAGCIACHTPGAPQSKIGPDLSNLARGLPMDMIVTETIWPALNVKEGYEAATITLNDGTVITGFKQTETAEAIAIRDMSSGVVKTFSRAGAQSVKTGGTVMPDGLTATLSPQQLADLFRYLSELGK